MSVSKEVLKKRAAALKLKLKRAAEVHQKTLDDALQLEREAAELEEEVERIVEPVLDYPDRQLRDTTPTPVPDGVQIYYPYIPSIEPKRSWWWRLFN